MLEKKVHEVRASKLTSCNSLYSIINLLVGGYGVGAIPTVTIKRELKIGITHQINVSKRFPPMPIIGSYQTAGETTLIKRFVEQAQLVLCDGRTIDGLGRLIKHHALG